MFARAISTLCLVLLGLAAIAWPLSQAGLVVSIDSEGSRRTLAAWQGSLWHATENRPPPKALERFHYRLTTGGDAIPVPGKLQALGRRGAVFAPSVSIRRLPLVWIVWGVLPVLLLGLAVPVLVRRRRARRGQCLACGYPASSAEAPCSECGTTPGEAAVAAARRPGVLVRDAGVLVFAVVLAASLGAWGVVASDERSEALSRANALDGAWYLEACQPRLSGAVAFAEPGSGNNNLDAVVRRMGAGATIVLLPGVHEFQGGRRGGPSPPLEDVWLVGMGTGTTTVKLRGADASRLRLDDLSIDCDNEPALEMRDGGTAMLRHCRVFNYNSGAGGSNAFFGVQAAFYVEACEFEGRTGRASGSMRGDAFDLRGGSRLFARGSQFVDNQEILRDADGILDGCVVADSGKDKGSPGSQFFPIRGERFFERGTEYQARPAVPASNRMLTELLDDPAPLARLAGGAGTDAWSDPVARGLAATLRLARDGLHWTSLLLSPSPEVREIATRHLQLAPPAAPPMAATFPGLEVPQLGPDLTLMILGAGPEVRSALESAKASGGPLTRGNAAALIRLLDVQPPLPEIIRAQGMGPPRPLQSVPQAPAAPAPAPRRTVTSPPRIKAPAAAPAPAPGPSK